MICRLPGPHYCGYQHPLTTTGITFVNGSAVSAKERQNAERFYLSRYAGDWAAAKPDVATLEHFMHEHPRYQDLVQGI